MRAKDYAKDGALIGGQGDGTFTSSDLDSIVADYKNRTQQKSTQAPIVIGRPVDEGEKVGVIGDIKRSGDTVLAQLVDLDPKAALLYDKGVFSKRGVQIERSPDGIALRSVGLIAPQWNGQQQTWVDDKTPKLDELYNTQFGTQNLQFSERSEPKGTGSCPKNSD